jgi:hypothetical protein
MLAILKEAINVGLKLCQFMQVNIWNARVVILFIS